VGPGRTGSLPHLEGGDVTDLRVVPPPLTLPSDQDASGRTLGAEELALLTEVIGSGTLTSTKGPQVPALEARFAELLGVRHAIACASGTAAVHLGVVAVDPEPGDEIITTPITDMGALSPILYQGAIPVFADVDVETCNVTADTIAAAPSSSPICSATPATCPRSRSWRASAASR
jgi:dTDP-4-amino-4,6-dideoxygalactose transaminase